MEMKIRCFLFVLLMILVLGLTGCVASGQKTASSTDQEKDRAIVEIKKMIEGKKTYTTEHILQLYDRLDPVNIDFMIGTWQGGKFDGGKMPDGTIHSFDKWGMARLREVRFRGKVTATLI